MNIRSLFTSPPPESLKKYTRVWFCLSLIYGVAFALVVLAPAWKDPYLVQDDARQILFWMERFVDPGLYPDDLIADYYQSVSPAGYVSVFKLLALMGADPIPASKVLPLLLGLAATAFCFGISMRLLPIPFAAFLSTFLLNDYLWTDISLVSATPRAFLYPLFLAFLYFLLRRAFLLCLLAVALLGFFYPSTMLISLGTLALRVVRLKGRRLSLSRDRADYVLVVLAVAIAAAVIVPFAAQSSKFGSPPTLAQARTLPDDLAWKRLTFLQEPFLDYWLTNTESGAWPTRTRRVPGLFAGLLLPFLMWKRSRFPLAQSIRGEVAILPRVLVASFGLFLAAHALLFKLYLPSRYTTYTIPVVLALAAGISFAVLLDALFSHRGGAWRQSAAGRFISISAPILLAALLLLARLGFERSPAAKSWIEGRYPELYEFFSGQPKDILIASLWEADNLPIQAKRSVLVAPQNANPYQPGYYLELRQRYVDLLTAHYTADARELRDFIQKYGIDFILIEKGAFTAEYVSEGRITGRFHPLSDEIASRLRQGSRPALLNALNSCSAFETNKYVVVRADCITAMQE